MAGLAERAPELGKYELLEEIGHGGMATVYRARDRRLGREVAIKLIHPHLRQNVEVASRFISEARTVAKLRHPNIVEVYDVSENSETERYLVVELIRGVTLRQLLTQQQRLPVEVAVGVALELAQALEHAHAEGVIHRDIKPENVLVELQRNAEGPPTVRVMLTDFGIAKLLDAQGITSTGQVLGSPAHMAPEQIEGSAVDVRADVFGLGVLLYECLVGHLPFDGKNPAQVLKAVLDGTFLPADKERPEVGARFANVVARALARDMERRYENIPAFARALRGELQPLGFESVLDEIAQLIDNPARYLEAYPQRIAQRLSSAGELARKNRHMAVAAQHFNRALAYRPGDPELLARVTGLRRYRQLRRAARLTITVLGVAAAVTLVGWQALALQRQLFAPVAPSKPPEAPPVARRDPTKLVTPPAEAIAEAVRSPKLLPRLGVKQAQKKLPPRRVGVRITGAMGGSLKIDGQAKEWFGVQHELEPGEHLFEFVPPDDTCCVAQVQRVLIKEGEGVQQVVGHLAFRDAVLLASSEPALEVRCPTLFAGVLRTPGEISVPMAGGSVTGNCNVTSLSEGSVPVKKTVTLRAGQTTQLPWP
ncbi:MAG TPA: serine/threonine-protein kinase [Polyangiaceae bacterium]|nr:serine/threonine-protein kinase [Polyangiaceae bacterium]